MVSSETINTIDRDSAEQKKPEPTPSSDLDMNSAAGSLGRFISSAFDQPTRGSSSLLSSRTLSLSANTAVRSAALRQAQRKYGNQFLQRALILKAQSTASSSVHVQRECACGGTCTACRAATDVQNESTGYLARDPDNSSTPSSPRIDRPQVSLGTGQPLDKESRSLMESQFDRELDQVRIHTDHHAKTSAENFNANAYTLGRDIYFAEGKYAPQTAEGRHLLAHEVAHTIQQSESRLFSKPGIQMETGLVLGDVDDTLEHEA